ncbi:MAG: DUF1761 domain-containing protein [Pseudomonadota bacterium]
MLTILQIFLAALGSWLFGAVWYGVLGKRWMSAAGVTQEQVSDKNPTPFIVSFLCALVVAAAMNHVLNTGGLVTLGAGLTTGASIGLFFSLPWIVTNYLFAHRDRALIWIDGTYAVVGSAIMGTVLTLW